MLVGYTYKGMFGLVNARVELKWAQPPIPELIVSSHSIIRFAERYFMFNTELERSKCAMKWGYKRDFKVTDAILDKWLKRNWAEYGDCVRVLIDTVGDRRETFTEYDMTFIIKDNVVVTVISHEE